jgi:coproporphyrinogen III oxidase-like Fe-S oxidoreductase
MPDLGVYLHIPFCASRCDYCAFATWTDREPIIGEYLDAVRTDIERTVVSAAASGTEVAAT